MVLLCPLLAMMLYTAFCSSFVLVKKQTYQLDSPLLDLSSSSNSTLVITHNKPNRQLVYKVHGSGQIGNIPLPNNRPMYYVSFRKPSLVTFQAVYRNQKDVVFRSQNNTIIQTQLGNVTDVIFGPIIDEAITALDHQGVVWIYRGKVVQKINLLQNPSKLYFHGPTDCLFVGTKQGSIFLKTIGRFWSWPDLIAAWNFQMEKVGDDPLDVTGTSTVISSAGQFTYGTAGLGTGSYLTLGGSTYFSVPSLVGPSFSICAWFKITNKNTLAQSIFSDNSQSKGFQLLISPRISQVGKIALTFYKTNVGLQQVLSQIQIQNNVWYFVVLVFDSPLSRITIFVNGNEEISIIDELISLNDPGNLVIGRTSRSGQTAYLTGGIDEIMLFSRVLTLKEILELSNRTLNKIMNFSNGGEITSIKFAADEDKLYTGDQQGMIKISNISSNKSSIIYTVTVNVSNHSIVSMAEFINDTEKFLVVGDSIGNMHLVSLVSNNKVFTTQNTQSARSAIISSQLLNDNMFIAGDIGSNNYSKWKIQPGTETNIDQPVDQPSHRGTDFPINQPTQSCYIPSLICRNSQSVRIAYICEEQQIYKSSDESLCIKCSSQLDTVNRRCVARIPGVSTTSTILSNTLSLPAARATMRVISPLFVLVQDLWFYKYHNVNYSDPLLAVFSAVEYINNAKIIPQFLQNGTIEQVLSPLGNDNLGDYSHYVPATLLDRDIETTSYFLNSKDIIVTGNAMSLFGFLFLLLAAALLKRLKIQYQILNKVFVFFSLRARWPFLLILLIQMNLISLTFYLFMQLKTPFYQNFIAKLTMGAGHVYLFIVIVYSLGSSLLVFCFNKKAVSEAILIHTNYSFSSFAHCAVVNPTRLLINGFLHSFLHQMYPLQISLIGLANLIQIFVIIYSRKCYQRVLFFLLSLLYRVGFTLIDLSLIIDHFFPQNKANLQDLQLYLLFLLVISTALLILSQMCFDILQGVKKYWKTFSRNAIQDNQQIQINNKEVKRTSALKSGNIFTFQGQQLSEAKYQGECKRDFWQLQNQVSQKKPQEHTQTIFNPKSKIQTCQTIKNNPQQYTIAKSMSIAKQRVNLMPSKENKVPPLKINKPKKTRSCFINNIDLLQVIQKKPVEKQQKTQRLIVDL